MVVIQKSLWIHLALLVDQRVAVPCLKQFLGQMVSDNFLVCSINSQTLIKVSCKLELISHHCPCRCSISKSIVNTVTFSSSILSKVCSLSSYGISIGARLNVFNVKSAVVAQVVRKLGPLSADERLGFNHIVNCHKRPPKHYFTDSTSWTPARVSHSISPQLTHLLLRQVVL